MKRLRVVHFSTFLLVFMLFNACGYRPSASYAKNVMGDRVSTYVTIDQKFPENSVIIKDAVDSAIIKRFKSSLTSRKNSTTHLDIRFSGMSFSPLEYDVNGYVISYRAKITLSIRKTSKNSSRSYVARGTYDFAIEPNATVSEQARSDAINFGSQKAINSFVAQVAAEGRGKNHDN